MLTALQKMKTRKHLGYPSSGDGDSGQQSWRFFETYGQLEYRMNHFTTEEEAEVAIWIARCDSLEAALYTSGENMDTASAGPWTRNAREHGDRRALYMEARAGFAAFVGHPLGPLAGGGGAIASVGLTV